MDFAPREKRRRRGKMFEPIGRMWQRVETARDDSDVALFYDLMKLGELVVKTGTAGLIAAVEDDRERHRYRLLHGLVRANGLGEWSKAAQDAMKPPVLEHLALTAREEQRELTQKSKAGSWQQEALSLLDECFEQVNVAKPQGPVTGLQWLHGFAHLRNKTRGHGAQPGEALSRACSSLEESIRLFAENFHLFRRPWAYLYLNQSGKHRVTRITAEADAFEALKGRSSQDTAYVDGVYLYLDRPALVELMMSDADLSDFYLPNGNFNGKRFELISYHSGDTKESDASPYNSPPVELPQSETAGGELQMPDHWSCLSNIPPRPEGYVDRHDPQDALRQKLTRSRHRVVTLSGRGGIGKTYLTLSVLHDIVEQGDFECVIWFSARDVDLRASGPRQVTQDVLKARDMAKLYVELIEPPEAQIKGFDELRYFCNALEKGAETSPNLYSPTLFVFDNFETVRDKREVYEIIDNFIDSPNKVLITTRERYFTGDYEIPIDGMTDSETQELIDATARDLGISDLLTQDYRRQLYSESEGHPYVIKILLGEVAKSGILSKVQRIMAGEEQILDALFERTFNKLSPQAQRVFLDLSNWRSVVPQIALEAVLLRDTGEEATDRIKVGAVVEELNKSSFAIVKESTADNERFIFVPLAASLFGRRVLPVSRFKNIVQTDLELLYKFGPTQQTDVQHGIRPKVNTLFRNVERERGALTKYQPLLEVVARRYPPSWRHMVSLYERSPDADDSLEKAKRTVEQYLQLPGRVGDEQERSDAWRKLSELRGRTADATGEVDALLEMCHWSECPIEDVSHSARRVLALFRQDQEAMIWTREEKRLLQGELADQMERRTAELYPNDFGYLAWLRFNRGEREKAEKFTKQGLHRDPENEHLKRFAKMLFV